MSEVENSPGLEISIEKFDEARQFNDKLQECFALVGEFMWHFSVLESKLDKLLERMMGLETLNAVILTSNIPIAKKINLAVCGLEYQAVDQDASKKLLRKFNSINDDRNIVAHCTFGPEDAGKGVKFYRTTANAKLKIEDIVWRKDEFTKKFRDMDAVYKRLSELIDVVSPVKSQAKSLKWLGESFKGGILGLYDLPDDPMDLDKDKPPKFA